MRKKYQKPVIMLMVAVLLMVVSPLKAAELSPYVNTSWGASPQKVIFWEKGDVMPHKSATELWATDYLIYHRTILDTPVVIHYNFFNKELHSTEYYLNDELLRSLTQAKARDMIEDIDSRIVSKFKAATIAISDKAILLDNGGTLWRYGKLYTGERTNILIMALVDEKNNTTHFCVTFADADHASGQDLAEVFHKIVDYSSQLEKIYAVVN